MIIYEWEGERVSARDKLLLSYNDGATKTKKPEKLCCRFDLYDESTEEEVKNKLKLLLDAWFYTFVV